jgi:hypothetical protein
MDCTDADLVHIIIHNELHDFKTSRVSSSSDFPGSIGARALAVYTVFQQHPDLEREFNGWDLTNASIARSINSKQYCIHLFRYDTVDGLVPYR